MKKLGFIGLGNMGKPMAKNLLKEGFELTVYDVFEAPVNELVDLGATRANSAKEAAESSDIVILMLPNSPHVENAVLGNDGVLEGAKQNSLIIDMSSIAPATSIKVADEAGKKGIRMIDAPVTGGVIGAVNGALSIMVGGSDEDVEEAMVVLNVLGKKITHVGAIGMGQTAKICNQIVVGISLCAVSEAMVLGTKAGIDPEKLQQILNSGSAHCWALETRIPNVIDGDFEPGFMINLQHKDLGLALEAGKDLHVPIPLAGLAYQEYEAARAQGLGTKDHSAVIQVLEKITEQKVRKSSDK